jgi:tRNA/tmRNA/rRNA uracil-C5-methylase (TrmA/RlmC/RlmD family)
MITINKQEKHEEPPQEKPKNYRATKLWEIKRQRARKALLENIGSKIEERKRVVDLLWNEVEDFVSELEQINTIWTRMIEFFNEEVIEVRTNYLWEDCTEVIKDHRKEVRIYSKSEITARTSPQKPDLLDMIDKYRRISGSWNKNESYRNKINEIYEQVKVFREHNQERYQNVRNRTPSFNEEVIDKRTVVDYYSEIVESRWVDSKRKFLTHCYKSFTSYYEGFIDLLACDQ